MCIFLGNIDQIALRLLIAAFLSGIIGYEREIHGRAAGLRTTILVGVGSCLIMLTSIQIYEFYKGVAAVDPSRIAAQVVSGIGFLGAGTILRAKASVRGLTTAAGLWAVSGIGLAVGIGFYSAAFLATALIFIVLVLLSRLESRIRKMIYKTLKLDLDGGMAQLADIRGTLKNFQVEVKNMEIVSLPQANKFKLVLNLKVNSRDLEPQIIESVSKIKGVTFVEWQ